MDNYEAYFSVFLTPSLNMNIFAEGVIKTEQDDGDFTEQSSTQVLDGLRLYII